jgi:hypothetical protein
MPPNVPPTAIGKLAFLASATLSFAFTLWSRRLSKLWLAPSAVLWFTLALFPALRILGNLALLAKGSSPVFRKRRERTSEIWETHSRPPSHTKESPCRDASCVMEGAKITGTAFAGVRSTAQQPWHLPARACLTSNHRHLKQLVNTADTRPAKLAE